MVTATYQGTAGVGLVRSWNINQSRSRSLWAMTASSRTGSLRHSRITSYIHSSAALTSFRTSTTIPGTAGISRSRNATLEELTLNATFNWSKSLSNDDSLSYYTRAGKARTADDHQKSFGAWIIYEL